MTADIPSVFIVLFLATAAVLIAGEVRGALNDLFGSCNCSCCSWCCRTCTCGVRPDDGDDPPETQEVPPDLGEGLTDKDFPLVEDDEPKNGHPCADRRFSPEIVNYVTE